MKCYWKRGFCYWSNCERDKEGLLKTLNLQDERFLFREEADEVKGLLVERDKKDKIHT